MTRGKGIGHKGAKDMRLNYQAEALAGHPDTTRLVTTASAAKPKWIDLDRVIWDPEYRDQVLEDMKKKTKKTNR